MKKSKLLLLLIVCLCAVCLVFAGCTQEEEPVNNDDPAQTGDEQNGNEDETFAITNELLKQAEADMLEALAPLPEMGNGEKIGAVAFSMTNPFWVTVQEGYEDAAKEYGVTVDVVASPDEADEQGQADAMTTLLAKDYEDVYKRQTVGR